MPLGWTVDGVAAGGDGAGWLAVADVPLLAARLVVGEPPGAAPPPLQALTPQAVTAQATATADAAARACHRFLPRCTPRL